MTKRPIHLTAETTISSLSKLFVLLIITALPLSVAAASLIDQVMSEVVAIGTSEGGKWLPLGTGFLMHNYDGPMTLLVTNRHVFQTTDSMDNVISRDAVMIKTNLKSIPGSRINAQKGDFAELGLPLRAGAVILWTGHPRAEVDLAVSYFPFPDTLNLHLLEALDIRSHAKSSTAAFKDLRLTQEVLFFGFPLGVGSRLAPTPVVRLGMISYLSDSGVFLIDGQVFRGSSGSPVYLTGIERFDSALGAVSGCLAGIVFGDLPSAARKVVVGTHAPRSESDTLTFENSGLGAVYSTDLIYETAAVHNRRLALEYSQRLKALGVR